MNERCSGNVVPGGCRYNHFKLGKELQRRHLSEYLGEILSFYSKYIEMIDGTTTMRLTRE